MEFQGLKRNITFFFAIVIASWVSPATGYIDPGSGSAIMSAIIGLFVAAGLAVKSYWYKVKSLFQKKKLDESSEPEAASKSPQEE